MSQFNFFAFDEDFLNIMHFVFTQTDLQVYESYSRTNNSIRTFTSVEQLRPLFTESAYVGHIMLGAWSPQIGAPPMFSTHMLDERVGGGMRTTIEGAGLITFSYFTEQNQQKLKQLQYGSITNWNEAGATGRNIVGSEQVNWPAMRSLTGQIHRHANKKLAAAHIFKKTPILPHAYTALKGGYTLWYSGQYSFGSPDIVSVPPLK